MGVSLQEDGPTFKVGCPGERLVNVALPDGVPSQARQLRDDWHLTASRHPGQEAVDISQSLSTVQAPFKRRVRWLVEGPVLPRAVFTGKMPRKWLIRSTVPLGIVANSPIRKPCFTHALGNPRTLCETGRIVRWRTGVEVGEGEIGIEGEPRLYRSPRLLDSLEMSQRRGKVEMDKRGDIPVGFDGSLEPVGSSFIRRKIRLRDARCVRPGERSVVTGRKPERLHDTVFGFLGATEITFAKSDPRVSRGQISIQRQRALAFGDARGGMFGKNLDDAKEAMRKGVVWCVRQYLG